MLGLLLFGQEEPSPSQQESPTTTTVQPHFSETSPSSTTAATTDASPTSHTNSVSGLWAIYEICNAWLRSLPPQVLKWLQLIPSVCMIVGACMPYIPQYMTIYRNKNHRGFSTLVCLTLLISNILRVAFYIGRHFDETLLIQSLVMIVFQMLLLELCVRMDRGAQKKITIRSGFRFFWKWTDLKSYLIFVALFAIAACATTYFLRHNEPFVEVVGFCATISESLLALPQAIQNFRCRSVEGMSVGMVLMWLAGDAYKTGYFVLKDQPIQFVICGAVQLTLDVIILGQVVLYGRQAASSTASLGEQKKKNSKVLEVEDSGDTAAKNTSNSIAMA